MYKFMNNPYIRQPFFAADNGGGTSGTGDGDSSQEDNSAGDGDDQDGEEDPDKDGDSDADEKKYTQKDIDAAVEKRLAREKRKWQRESQKTKKSDSQPDNDGKEPKEEDAELTKERKRNEKLTMRLACYDAGVPKDSVKDVTALAKAYMEDDEDLDFEDAIEKVLKKYPQFKSASDDNAGGKGAWGQRQRGKGAKSEKSLQDEITEALYGK